MTTTIDHAVMPNEDCVVQRLRECGASSFEDLARLPGQDWVTVFSIIDRLTRAGFVVLERNGADYWVSLEKGT
jgi:predicted transcriptional regulator